MRKAHTCKLKPVCECHSCCQYRAWKDNLFQAHLWANDGELIDTQGFSRRARNILIALKIKTECELKKSLPSIAYEPNCGIGTVNEYRAYFNLPPVKTLAQSKDVELARKQ